MNKRVCVTCGLPLFNSARTDECVACTDYRGYLDRQLRLHVERLRGRRLALLVPCNSEHPCKTIDLADKARAIPESRPVPRHPDAWLARSPYMAHVEDVCAQCPKNKRARTIAAHLGVFHTDAEWRGDVVFAGPLGLSLLPKEIKEWEIKIY